MGAASSTTAASVAACTMPATGDTAPERLREAAHSGYAVLHKPVRPGKLRALLLHLLDVAGGWPGGLVAQQLMRHKTAKPAFVAMFWTTVMLNMGGFVAWHAGGLQGLLS